MIQPLKIGGTSSAAIASNTPNERQEMFKQTQLTEVRSVGSMAGYAAGINNETKERTTNEVLVALN